MEQEGSFYKRSIIPVRNKYNSFNVPCKHWMSTRIAWVRVIEKTLILPKHAREKWKFRFMPWYFVFSFLVFGLEPTVRKSTWMRTTSVALMVVFLKISLWKFLDHSYFQSSFSPITRYIDNSICETFYSWRFYGNGLIYVQTDHGSTYTENIRPTKFFQG